MSMSLRSGSSHPTDDRAEDRMALNFPEAMSVQDRS